MSSNSMSLWITSNQEADGDGPPSVSGGAEPSPEGERRFYRYVLVGLIGLSLGLVLGQLAAEHLRIHSRIPWPAPALPHPRTLPP